MCLFKIIGTINIVRVMGISARIVKDTKVCSGSKRMRNKNGRINISKFRSKKVNLIRN